MPLLNDWHSRFDAEPPMWWEEFEASADRTAALDRLLRGGATLGALSGADPGHLLGGWLTRVGPESEFAAAVDGAALGWLEWIWGGGGVGDLATAAGVSRLLRVVQRVPDALPGCVDWLTAHHSEHEEALRPHSPSAKMDNVGAYLLFLATLQSPARLGRTLLDKWLQLCDGQGVLLEHATIGMVGLRYLPPDPTVPFTSPSPELAGGILRTATALAAAVSAGACTSGRALRILGAASRGLVAAYPEVRWSDEIGPLVGEVAPHLVRDWLDRLFGGMPATTATPRMTATRGAGDRYAAPEQAGRIAEEIRRDPVVGARLAEELLSRQRRLAETFGDPLPLTQSICWFAHELTVRARDEEDRRPYLDIAVGWATEATAMMPENHYGWVTLARAVRERDGEIPALNVLLPRIQRYPSVSYVHFETLLLLVRAHAYPVAAAFARQIVERFPSATWVADATRRGEVAERRITAAIKRGSAFDVPIESWSVLAPAAQAVAAMLHRHAALVPGATLVDELATTARRICLAAHQRAPYSVPVAREWLLSGAAAEDQDDVRGERIVVPVTSAVLTARTAQRERRNRYASDHEWRKVTLESTPGIEGRLRLKPLVDLVNLRAWASLRDGDDHRRRGREALRGLVRAAEDSGVDRHQLFSGLGGEGEDSRRVPTLAEHRGWWAGRVVETLSSGEVTDAFGDSWRPRLDKRASALDLLEEDYVGLVEA